MRSTDDMAAPRGAHQRALARIIEGRLCGSGDYETAIPHLRFFRRDEAAPPTVCMVEPSIVFVAQGAKRLWVGGEGYMYDSSRLLVTSLDLPAGSEVLTASAEQPCVGLALKLDMRVLAELIAQGGLPAPDGAAAGAGMGLGMATADILAPLERLLALLDDPAAIPVIAPLIQREIYYRLLRGDQAGRLRRITAVDSQGHRITKAIDWLKTNFTQSLRVEDLAARVQMSATTFHQHFRQLTAMSPLQYQKWLRLNEAKRLMLNEDLDAASAAYKVGYESPSQFSREYSRLYGMSPKRDIMVMRGRAADGV
ncbi:AraC family transcriptional regulator [Oxalobacteraceae bacterium OTU3CAMAD1]|nr:AraC family transcriptional regulator [Oxalobacteraceae bacterium OTU3CAMAD1]